MSWNSISVFSRVWFNIKDFNCKIVSQGSAVSKSGIFWLLWFLGDFSNIFSCSSSVFVIGSNYASKSSTFPGKTSQTLLRLTAFAFWRSFFDILAAVFPFLSSAVLPLSSRRSFLLMLHEKFSCRCFPVSSVHILILIFCIHFFQKIISFPAIGF